MTDIDADPVATAITALTTAARRRRTIGAGTAQEHTEPVDAAEILCNVVTAVAANLGGAEQLLAGRPGSWEADHIRRIVLSTAGDDDDELLRYRTEPIQLEIDAEDIFADLGIYDLYDNDLATAGEAQEQARRAVFESLATPEELTRAREIEASLTGVIGAELDPDQTARVTELYKEHAAIDEQVWQRAEATGGPLVEAAAAADRLVDRIDELWEADKLAYRAACQTAARQWLAERGPDHPEVELVDPMPDRAWTWDPVVEDLLEHIRTTAPLPQSGQAPDWTQGTPSEALRRAGVTYTDRAKRERA